MPQLVLYTFKDVIFSNIDDIFNDVKRGTYGEKNKKKI